MVLLGLAGGGVVTSGYVMLHRYEGKVHRENLLDDAARPGTQKLKESEPLNLLLLGSDSREDESDADEYPGQRSDAVMVLHVNRNRDQAVIVSIPRDSYVHIPARNGWPGGMNKLNAAFALGGAPLVAQTIADLTGLSLDGALVANFAAVRRLVDAVGGVDVRLPYPVVSTDSGRSWPQGCHHLDGAAADDLVRQRHNLPNGDLDRIRDQQLIIKAIAEKIVAENMATNPLKLDRLLVTAASALIVDQDLDVRWLALAFRKIRPENIGFVTAPLSNLDLNTPAGSAIELDPTRSNELFDALRQDTAAQWLTANPQPQSGP